jgi:tetratricopeptide (TPR) repeat protein
MKKLVFTGILCFIVFASFGQKKSVNSAKSEIKRDNPNIEDARKFINEALANPETKDSPETWYVAGAVENKQLDMEAVKLYKGAAPDEEVMYTALLNIIPYFLEADKLDQLPNEKGKIKPKFRKDMKSVITANLNHYPNAGVYFYNKTDYKNAFIAFKQYIDVPDMEMFKDDKEAIKKDDESYLQIKYNAANMASMMENHAEAIELFTAMKYAGYEENEVFRRLTYEYNQLNDSTALLGILKEGVQKFPDDEYFLLNLIDKSIQSNRLQEAIEYLNVAIERKPSDPVFYDALGVIYENTDESDKALLNYEKALELDPENAKVLKHKGMVYYNLAVKTRAKADESSLDKEAIKKEDAKVEDLFKKSLPFFEKSYSIDSSDNETVFCLRSVYYALGMGEEYQKIDAVYSKGQ